MELKEVDGMLLDRFTASYYQSRGKLKSLITVKTFKLRRNVGILISKDRSYLETCLKYLHLPEILKSVQTVTATYKVMFTFVCHFSLDSLFKIQFVL